MTASVLMPPPTELAPVPPSPPDARTQLQAAGFAPEQILDVTVNDTYIEPVLAKVTKLPRRKVEEQFAEAFNDPAGAARRLSTGVAAAIGTLERDRGAVSVAEISKIKRQGVGGAVLASTVTQDGRILLAAKQFPAKSREVKSTAQAVRAIGSRPSSDGIVHRLVPSTRAVIDRLTTARQQQQGALLWRIKMPPKVKPPTQPTKTPLVASLAALRPTLNFRKTAHGYTPAAGYGYAQAMLDPEQRTHGDMIGAARLARTLGRHAMGFRRSVGKRSAALFAEQPEIWQPLIHVAEGVETAPASGSKPNIRQLLVEQARAKVAEINQDGREALTAPELASFIGAGVLGLHSPVLRKEISTTLADRLVRSVQEQPQAPTKPASLGWKQRLSLSANARQAKKLHRQDKDEYRQQKTDYEANLAAYQREQYIHADLGVNGGWMLGRLLKLYTQRVTKERREGVFFSDSNSKWGMEDVAHAIVDPSELRALHSRVLDERGADRHQFWEWAHSLWRKATRGRAQA